MTRSRPSSPLPRTVDVRVVRIPVIDSDPIDLGAEIPLGLRHQVSDERLEIGELLRVLRGHDEPEMMPVAFAAVGEGAVVGIVVLGIEHPTGSAVPRYAFPPQIGQVSPQRRSSGHVPHDARFKSNAACPVRHQPRGRDARSAAATERSAPPAPSGSPVQATCSLGCRQCLRYERINATGAAPPPVSDAAKTDAEIVIAGHGVIAREVRVVANFQGVVRIGRLSCTVAPRARSLMYMHFSAARPSRSLRLLSCHRAVGYAAAPGLTVESATTPEIPRKSARLPITASTRHKQTCRLVRRLLPDRSCL
jgi:hypothetical protein